jgi:Mrp family chromosome partitioning ATPase
VNKQVNLLHVKVLKKLNLTKKKGCPNQQVCSSGEAAKIDPAIQEIKECMKNIKHKILILSGKGGVGKSTVFLNFFNFKFSSQFALALSQDENTQVGLLDVDLCGPSIPKMMNLENEQLSQSNLGWQPAYYEDNLAVISIGFLLPNKDDPVVRSFKLNLDLERTKEEWFD